MTKIKIPGGGGHHPPRHHKLTDSHHQTNNIMDKVKIKRVNRKKKTVTTKEKILAGLGVGGSLMGGIAGIAPQKPQHAFDRILQGLTRH